MPAKRARPSPKAILRGHASPLAKLTFFHDHLLSGDESGTLRLWNVWHEAGILTHRSATKAPVQSIAHNPAWSNSVLVQYKTGVLTEVNLEYDTEAVDLEAWRVANTLGRRVGSGNGVADSFCGIVFIEANVWAGPGGDSNVIVVRDSRTKCEGLAVLQSGDEMGMLMALCEFGGAGGTRLLAGYENGRVLLWDMRKATEAVGKTKVGEDAVTCIASSPLGRVAVVGGAFGHVGGVVEMGGGLECMVRERLREDGVADVCFGEDGRVCYSGGWDGCVRVWNGRRTRDRFLKRVVTLRWHEGGCASVVGGKVVASGGKDRTIAIWEI